MTNDEIMALKTDAENLAQSFCKLVLDGDGRFLDITTVGPREVPASDVLRMFTQAERLANKLYLKLDAIPLITRSRKAPAGEQLRLEHKPDGVDA